MRRCFARKGLLFRREICTMSYCRFSSEHWTSDVYVYESCRGFVIHVAEARHTSSEPYPVPPELLWERPPDEILYWLNKERDWLRAAVLTPIGLSRDGAVIETGTPAEADLNKTSANRKIRAGAC